MLPISAQVMLKELVHIHILGQAHHQVLVKLLVLLGEGLHIQLAQGRVQITHAVHVGGDVVHGLPDAVVTGIGGQALVELVIQVDEVIARLEGINCNGRGTSCPDQLSIALEQVLNK